MTPFDWYVFYFLMSVPCAFFIGFPCCAIYYSYKENKQHRLIEREKHREEMEKLYYNCLERIENMKERNKNVII